MRDIFTDIYQHDKWNGGSGPGSRLAFCAPLHDFLRAYIAQHNIGSLCDLGCGDLQWMPKLVTETALSYIGVDCVDFVLSGHTQRYPAPQFQFVCADLSQLRAEDVPAADLYFMKDVLQHWPNSEIERFLDAFFHHRPTAHLLVANCAYQKTDRRALDSAYFAPLSGDYMPLRRYRPVELFGWDAKRLYRLYAPA